MGTNVVYSNFTWPQCCMLLISQYIIEVLAYISFLNDSFLLWPKTFCHSVFGLAFDITKLLTSADSLERVEGWFSLVFLTVLIAFITSYFSSNFLYKFHKWNHYTGIFISCTNFSPPWHGVAIFMTDYLLWCLMLSKLICQYLQRIKYFRLLYYIQPQISDSLHMEYNQQILNAPNTCIKVLIN